ncbi:hypothetical protein SAMN02745166_04602, partial [Prosthecobacter debontii]
MLWCHCRAVISPDNSAVTEAGPPELTGDEVDLASTEPRFFKRGE